MKRRIADNFRMDREKFRIESNNFRMRRGELSHHFRIGFVSVSKRKYRIYPNKNMDQRAICAFARKITTPDR
mgnify:CR=1 FL=1